MKILCSNCNQRLEIPEELAGQTIECPACKASLAVPPLAPPPSATPQVKVTTPQAATPQKPSPRKQTSASPKAASGKKSKSPIPKWAVACIASVVILSLFFVLTAKVEAPDISIHDAAYKGNIKAVKQHLAAGTDVDVKDILGATALHSAASSFDTSTLSERKEIAELLIAKGAKVNTRDSSILAWTPLDWAKKNNHHELIDLLRKNGAK